jgi:hypothetical protein
MSWPSVYSFNFCENPSFEQDLTGVEAVMGAAILQDRSMAYSGMYSLNVTTPGMATGEGVALPPGDVLATSSGAVSFYLQGNTPTSTGTLNIYVLDLTSSATLGSTTVTFTPQQSWQRVQVTGLSLVNAHSIQVWVETATPQITSFNIDAVQYEPSLTLNSGNLPTPYIDGDQPFGFWVGTPEESASYKLYQFQMGASGDILTFGQGSLLVQGLQASLVFSDPASGPTQITGGIDLSGLPHAGPNGTIIQGPGGTVVVSGITTLLMLAGLDNFAIWQAGDADPAQTLVSYNNAGVSTGTNTSGSAGYTRPFSTFSAPQAFSGSLSYNIWNTAAYYAVGYQFGSLANNAAQNISHVQAELVPFTGGNPVPSAYQRPRALTAILAPTTMNYVTNPSFTNDTTGWAAVPSTTISRTTAQKFIGGASLFMTGTGTNIGAYIPVPDLIVGETYTASGYVLTTDVGTRNVTVAINPGSTFTSVASATVTALTTGWTQVDVQFTATTSTTVLAFWCQGPGGTSTTMNWYLDGVMVNPGGLVPYGDGYTSGWSFEGTPGDSRSYYYERGNIAYAAIQEILADHLPYGLHAYAPVYFTPVTQYS